MRATLRRSCAACAKAKHRCDLRTPQCSRCIRRNSRCVYANEPLTSSPDTQNPASSSGSGRPAANYGAEGPSANLSDGRIVPRPPGISLGLLNPANASLDPFDSYPPTRLPRVHVQRLIHHFLSSIAFQYYPLDLNSESNPFVVSWWPLALEDPALFHVSLQTASLDAERRAQKGFPTSELLMIDSVSLVRRKVENRSSAFQDETMNSVVTLAAIEYGKGNIEASRMHIEGVKRMVSVRGGIGEVKRASPLTARMVSWVSLLVMGTPQFQAQDDSGSGNGIGPIQQWQLVSTTPDSRLTPVFSDIEIDPAIGNILARLRSIFHEPWPSYLTTTELHDLTCFVMHRLLLLPPQSPADSKESAVSECIRYTLALYMLIVHGTTYYSHADLANGIIFQLKAHLAAWARTNYIHGPLKVWVLSIGMITTIGTPDNEWFMEQACSAIVTLSLQTWEDVLAHLESILWLGTQQEELLRQEWEYILKPAIK